MYNHKIRHILHIDLPDYSDTLGCEREPIIIHKPKLILNYKVKTNKKYAKTKHILINHMYSFLKES